MKLKLIQSDVYINKFSNKDKTDKFFFFKNYNKMSCRMLLLFKRQKSVYKKYHNSQVQYI